MSNSHKWVFTEDQRPAVCEGLLCPLCLGTEIKCVGCNPTPTHMNAAYDCQTCGEQWEGY